MEQHSGDISDPVQRETVLDHNLDEIQRERDEWEDHLNNSREAREYLHDRREALGEFQREQQQALGNFHHDQREALQTFHRKYLDQVEAFQRILQVEMDSFRRERQEQGAGYIFHDLTVEDPIQRNIVVGVELRNIQRTHREELEGSQQSHQEHLDDFQLAQQADLLDFQEDQREHPYRHVQGREPTSNPTIDQFISSLPIIDPDSIPAEDRACTICQEPYVRTDATDQNENEEIVRLPCNGGHIFGIDCLKTFWVPNQFDFVTCPLCRERFVVDDPYPEDGLDSEDGVDY